MSTFHTDHGTVRYDGIRRYIVVTHGTIVKRTDNINTAHKFATLNSRMGATVVDTKREVIEAAAKKRVCTVCKATHVPLADWNDPVYVHRHWHCIPKAEREAITAAWREEHAAR